jgi:hypothetical protein
MRSAAVPSTTVSAAGAGLPRDPCAPAAQLAGLTARAHAKAGRPAAARTELDQAGQILAKTVPDSGFFGFTERELLMYRSGVLTSISDPATFDAQTAALDAYPANDPMDRPLIRLDRARHLATQTRDPHATAQTAITAITDLPAPLRVPLLITQAKTITPAIAAISPQAARQYHEELTALTA